MNKEWTECYEYFKNRKFIERPKASQNCLKQTTISLKNANYYVDPKPVSYSQEDSEEPQKQETGWNSKTT